MPPAGGTETAEQDVGEPQAEEPAMSGAGAAVMAEHGAAVLAEHGAAVLAEHGVSEQNSLAEPSAEPALSQEEDVTGVASSAVTAVPVSDSAPVEQQQRETP